MLNEYQIHNIQELMDSGDSIKEIVRKTGVSSATIYKYRKLKNPNDSRILVQSYPQGVPKKLTPHLLFIQQQIKLGVTNAQKIYTTLKEKGYQGSYALVNNFVRKDRPDKKNRHYKKVETDPGIQAQVDWGQFPKININGSKSTLYVFVYVLSYSRMAYAEFTLSQRMNTLQRCHMNAFKKLGIPKFIRYDNMKTVVASRKKINGETVVNFNPELTNFSRHYQFRLEVCPPYYPQSKGKVESMVKYIKRNFMNGHKYRRHHKSLDDLNAELTVWLDNTANIRKHATTQESPTDRWGRERQFLFNIDNYPLYQNDIRSARYSSQNSMVTFKRNSYSVPIEYARKKIDVLEINKGGIDKLEFYYKGVKIIEHTMSKKIGDWISIPENEDKVSQKKNKEELRKWRHIDVPKRDLSYYNKLINI